MALYRISTMELTDSELNYLVNHLFLPPKLPQQEEKDRHKKDDLLSKYILSIADEFNSLVREADGGTNEEVTKAWRVIHRMLEKFQRLHSSETLDANQLGTALLGMQVNGTSHSFYPNRCI